MVLLKASDNGFNGYQVPHIPRAARSVRKRSLFNRKGVDQPTCAFDLLATVAGKLLLDGEDSPQSVNTSSSPKEQPSNAEDSIEKKEDLEQKSLVRNCHARNLLFAQNGGISRPLSGLINSDGSEKELVNEECKLRVGILDVESSGFRLYPDFGPEDENTKQIKLDSSNSSDLSLEKPSTLVRSVDSVNYPFREDNTPFGSFPIQRDDIKLINLDGDTIRKSLVSKDCKLTPAAKDGEHYNGDTERCNYPFNKKESFKRQRSVKDYPFKKRKLYDSTSPVSNSGEGIIKSEGICCVPQNGTEVGQTPTSAAALSFHSRDHQVKLKIKSFRVPELIIDIPATASVGSLKRKVMEAMNAMLGSELGVGVILQGKKITDDNKTLLQTGISHDNNKMGTTLCFVLEPSPVQGPIKLYHENRPRQLLHDSPQPLARYPLNPSIGGNAFKQRNVVHNIPPVFSGNSCNDNFIETDHYSAAPSPCNMSLQKTGNMLLQKTVSESKAMVVVAPNNKMRPDAALALIPLRKSKRSESLQRRIRRPFSVAEVETLVQAVEKLGTGRWRDVKLRAFDNAKHRTYVDLKDK